MASGRNARRPEDVRRDIEVARDDLATSIDTLRDRIGEATNVAAQLRARLPLVAAAAVGAGFFLAGGVGATMRLLARRGREGDTKARVGRFSIVDRG